MKKTNRLVAAVAAAGAAGLLPGALFATDRVGDFSLLDQDGYYESLSVWDYAAAQLIAKEAGAVYGHFGDVPEGDDPQFCSADILVANAALFEPLRALLRSASDNAAV